MILVKINGIEKEIVQSWSEVTMKQYIEMNEYKDELNYCRLLSILTGIDYNLLQSTNADSFSGNIFELLGEFNHTTDFTKLPVPNNIELNGKVVAVPTDIKTETFGQKVLMHEKLNKIIDDKASLINMFSEIASIYLQPGYHGELYNDKKVPEVKAIVEQKPVTEVYPIANFFLTNYIQSLKMKSEL